MTIDTTDDVLVEQRARRAVLGQRGLRTVLFGAVGVVVLLVGWQAVVSLGGLDPLVLPTPLIVARQFGTLLGQGKFWHDLGTSLFEFACGFGLGTVCGISLGLAMSELARLRMTLHPVVEAFRFVVPFAWIPLVVLWFGTSFWGKIMLVGYAVFFVMVISTSESVRHVDPTLSRVATVLGMSPLRQEWSVRLRAAAPSIASACRASAALGWIAVVAAEYVGSSSGLGNLIINASTSLDTAVVIAGMVVIGLVGAGVSALISWVSRKRLSYI